MASPARRVRCILLTVAVTVAACGETGPERAPAKATLGPGTDVSYATVDGVRISATLRLPPNRAARPAPAVVLVHQLDGDRQDFNALLPALGRAGYATLVYDIRGMGHSNGMVDGTVFRPGADRDAYLATMPRDVMAALRFLRGRRDIDGERLAVVGSSLGANIAIASSASRGGPDATVGVSPVADAAPIPAADRHGERPHGVLLIANRVEIGSVWTLARRVDRPKRVTLAHREGHGVMLLPDPAVQAEIVAWLVRHLKGRPSS